MTVDTRHQANQQDEAALTSLQTQVRRKCYKLGGKAMREAVAPRVSRDQSLDTEAWEGEGS